MWQKIQGWETVYKLTVGKGSYATHAEMQLPMSRTNLGLIHITAFIWPSWRFNFNYVLSAVQFQWNLVFLVHYNKLFSQIQLKLSVYFLGSLKWPYSHFLWCVNVPFIVENSCVKILGVEPSVVLNAFNLRRGRQVSVSSSIARATQRKLGGGGTRI